MARVALGVVAIVALTAGCGSSGSSAKAGGDAPKGCVPAKNGTITIVTKQYDFSPDCVATTGTTLKVTYNNAESGVQHNIDFKTARSSTGSAKTDLKTGPSTQTITLVGLKPGTYTYVCDIHPSMSGQLKVS